jgi:long-chain acyl-CoA synthetase
LAQLGNAAELLASRLSAAGIHAGDAVAIWGENRPQWLVAFWGCVLAGGVVVPVDAHASIDLLRRIVDIARVRALFAGDDPDVTDLARTVPVWRLRDIEWPSSPTASGYVRVVRRTRLRKSSSRRERLAIRKAW